jgi:ketosteroid isomerase-like protein
LKFPLPLLAVILLAASALAQTSPVSASARAGIDAGNQAWVDGVKTGDVARILATYAPHSVDCGAKGDCFIGLAQIEQHMKAQLAASGRARSAAAHTWGATQHGNFVYEWGQAEANFEHGGVVADTYLTVWQKQPDGSWKIFRNLVIPASLGAPR